MIQLAACLIAASVLVSLRPIDGDRADVVEINRVVAEDGTETLVQTIWWNWDCDADRWQVVDWQWTRAVQHHSDYGDQKPSV